MNKLQEFKSVVIVALPLTIAFIAQKGMQFIDAFMMGWIGPNALAAGALATSFFLSITLFCMGTLSIVGVFISHAKGSNDLVDIQSNLLHGLYLAIFLSVPCTIILCLTPTILSYLGENPLVVQDVSLFLHSLAWGFPGLLLFLVMREFISSFSLTRVVMLVTITAIPLTFLVNYVLIYGKFGLPKLGISGIGYSGAILMWLMFFCLVLYSRKHYQLKQFCSFTAFTFNFIRFKNMVFFGIPSGALFLLESITALFSTLMMAKFGVYALAAHQIGMQYVSIAYSIPAGLSMATALLVGYEAGSKKFSLINRLVCISLITGLLLTLFIAVFFFCFPEKLVQIFINSDAINANKSVVLATRFLAIAAIFLVFDAAQAIINGALRGLKDTFVPMTLSISCYLGLGLGSAYYFSFHTKAGALGIWYGLVLGVVCTTLLLFVRYINKILMFVDTTKKSGSSVKLIEIENVVRAITRKLP